jgi:hypothetical protein
VEELGAGGADDERAGVGAGVEDEVEEWGEGWGVENEVVGWG